MELELALKQELLERSGKLAAKDATQDPDGQQETWRSCTPSRAIDRKTSSRNDAVDMRMMLQVLSPGVQDAEQTDVSSKVLRVASHFEQRCATGAKE